MAMLQPAELKLKVKIEDEDALIVVLRIGYEEILYFSKIEAAMMLIQGILLSKKSNGKHYSIETWCIDKKEYDWEMLSVEKKSKYPSLDYYRYGIKKQQYHLDIDEEYEKYRMEDGKKWSSLDSFLQEKGLTEKYKDVPDILLKGYTEGTANLGGGLEFGKSADKKEVGHARNGQITTA